jgi:hypothetical protein
MTDFKCLSRETACSHTEFASRKLKMVAAYLKWVRDNSNGGAPPLSYWEFRDLSLARDDIDAVLKGETT